MFGCLSNIESLPYLVELLLFQYLVAGGIARHGEYMTIPRQFLVLLYYLLGNVQQTDVRYGICFPSACDNPQVAVKECLKVVLMPFGFELALCWLCANEKQSVTNATQLIRYALPKFTFPLCVYFNTTNSIPKLSHSVLP